MTKFWEAGRLAQAAHKPFAKATIEKIAELAEQLAAAPTEALAAAFQQQVVLLTQTAQGTFWE